MLGRLLSGNHASEKRQWNVRGTNVNERRVRSLTVAVWLTIDATMDNVARVKPQDVV
mgnify:CR=1 FL=1